MNNAAEDDALTRAVAAARRRLLPFLVLMYLLAFIDRANIGFAKAALQADTGISDAAFAFGAGIFFLGYAIFEVPSNLMLYRVGARRWLSRIMISWGVVSASMAFAHDAGSYYVLRFLLGVAEAGFFPGIVLYLTLWFPERSRARAMGIFYFGFPLALMLGGPLSGALLDMDAPWGLKAWQWMFVVEGLLASAVGIVAYWYLPDRPADARWLTKAESGALTAAIAGEESRKSERGPRSLWRALGDARVMLFCLIYFTIQVSVYGVVFYLPSRIAALTGGHIGTSVGLLTAIPWLVAIVTAFFITRLGDKTGRYRTLAAAALAVSACGIAASAFIHSVPLALLAYSVAAAGFVSAQPLFWNLPTAYLSGVAAAAGIGLINAIGNLGGFISPNLKGAVEHASGNAEMGMFALAGAGLIGAAALAAIGSRIGEKP